MSRLRLNYGQRNEGHPRRKVDREAVHWASDKGRETYLGYTDRTNRLVGQQVESTGTGPFTVTKQDKRYVEGITHSGQPVGKTGTGLVTKVPYQRQNRERLP